MAQPGWADWLPLGGLSQRGRRSHVQPAAAAHVSNSSKLSPMAFMFPMTASRWLSFSPALPAIIASKARLTRVTLASCPTRLPVPPVFVSEPPGDDFLPSEALFFVRVDLLASPRHWCDFDSPGWGASPS